MILYQGHVHVPSILREAHLKMCVCPSQALKGLCLDSKRSKVLQRLELSLEILGGTVERISNTAEVLGAVHQVLPPLTHHTFLLALCEKENTTLVLIICIYF